MTMEEYNKNPNKCKKCGKPIICKNSSTLQHVKIKKFCNRSCSVSYNNTRREKKKNFVYCKKCGKLLREYYSDVNRNQYCLECNPNLIDWSNLTLREVKEKRKYQPYSRIRNLARNKYLKSEKIKFCALCGYDKHFEVCHIKAICDYNENSKISEINDFNNLIALCRNCHWELDNGLLNIRDLPLQFKGQNSVLLKPKYQFESDQWCQKVLDFCLKVCYNIFENKKGDSL